MTAFVEFCRKISHSHKFENTIFAVILLNAIVIGLETSPSLVNQFGFWFHLLNQIVLAIFVIEAVLKMSAEYPNVVNYFKHGWNVFDFAIIVASFLPTGGQFATAARLVRVLRITRLFSVVPELRLIVATLFRSLPSMGHIVILLGILFYIYGIIGYYLFHTTDPLHWGNFGAALLTLFGVVTLETWVDTMKILLPTHPFAWIYFVSFIVVGTFMFVNLFVAVVINNLSEAKKETLEDLQIPVSKEDLLKELRLTKESLERLEAKLGKE